MIYEGEKNPHTNFQPLQSENKDIWDSPGKAQQGKSRICTKEELQKEEDTVLNVMSLWHLESERIFLKYKRAGRICRDYVALKQNIVSQRWEKFGKGKEHMKTNKVQPQQEEQRKVSMQQRRKKKREVQVVSCRRNRKARYSMREMEGNERSNRRMWLGEKVARLIRRSMHLRSNVGLWKALWKYREMRIISGDNKNRPKKWMIKWVGLIQEIEVVRLKSESTLELFFKGEIALKQIQQLYFHRYSLALNTSWMQKQHSGQ